MFPSKFRVIVSCLVALVLWQGNLHSQNEAPKVGVLDVKRVMREAQEMVDFNKHIDDRVRRYYERKNEIESEMADLMQQITLLNEGSRLRSEKTRNLAQLQAELSSIRLWTQQGGRVVDVLEYSEDFFLKLTRQIKTYGTMNKFTMIFRKSLPVGSQEDLEGVDSLQDLDMLLAMVPDLYVDSALDITGDFLAYINKEYGRPATIHETRATVYRDEWGVPHIIASQNEAVFYAFGYAQAEDRVEEMMKAYLTATGRMAAVFGEKYVESDKLVRMLKIPATARELKSTVPISITDKINAFIEGYNTYVAEHRKELKEWVAPVQLEDVLALGLYLNLAPAIGQLNEEAKSMGSNMFAWGRQWVADPVGSIVTTDTHLDWNGPYQWYEADLDGYGFHVYGVALVGMPFIALGFNEKIAWSATMNHPDLVDIYEETVKDGKSLRGDEWLPVETASETVDVKGGKSQTFTFEYIEGRGPVVKEKDGKKYSAAISNWRNLGMFTQLYSMNIADSIEQFGLAMSMRAIPLWSFVCSDTKGSVYYLYNATVPRREDGVDWTKALPGGDKNYEWGADLPFNNLPQEMDPACGYFFNCNDAPWFVCPDTKIIREKVPAWLCPDTDLGARGKRAASLLRQAKQITFEEASRIVVDKELYGTGAQKTAFRMIVQMGEHGPVMAQSMLPYGQTARSGVYKDQDALYKADGFKRVYYRFPDVVSHAKSVWGRSINYFEADSSYQVSVRLDANETASIETANVTAPNFAPLVEGALRFVYPPDVKGVVTIRYEIDPAVAGDPAKVHVYVLSNNEWVVWQQDVDLNLNKTVLRVSLPVDAMFIVGREK